MTAAIVFVSLVVISVIMQAINFYLAFKREEKQKEIDQKLDEAMLRLCQAIVGMEDEGDDFVIYIKEPGENPNWEAMISGGIHDCNNYQATSLVQLMHTIGYDLARLQSEANQDSEETPGEQY